jgi:peptidoglycan hydrolase-like protein with peptidoglycan-binding domain
MAKMQELSYGSQGSVVKLLQEKLNAAGYKLDTDGIFGAKTQSAVKDYQKNNNLAVDGIVGTNTWGSLQSGPKTVSGESTANLVNRINGNTGYQESYAVKKASEMLQQQMSQKPGEYKSQWQSQLDDMMKQIMNREKFSYDMNADALYQQYKDQYTNLGKMAMMDTMGQAAAMTGGYGNSYAQTAGQQMYQGHLQQLNDKIPELYQLALNKYQMEGDQIMNQYGLLADRESQDYGRYRDSVSDWTNERNYLQDQYNAERDFDYGKYIDTRNFDYQQNRDAVADSQWQKEFDEAVRQFNKTNPSSSSSKSGSSSGGKNGSSSSSSKNNDKPEEQLEEQPEEQPKTTFKDVTKKCNDYIEAGASKSEISAYINEQRQLGNITADEARSLKATMTPRGLTY